MSTQSAIPSLPVRPPRAKVFVPGTSIALLSYTTKMDTWSWGMTAGAACPFAVRSERDLHPGELPVDTADYVCASCYAMQGMYAFPAVRRAYAARFAWATSCMRTDAGRTEFVETMVSAIRSECGRFGLRKFRIHDAGDFFSPAYAACWYEICARLPDIRFWAPTRSYRAKWLPVLVRLNTLPNVAISPSGLTVDGPVPVIPGLAGGSTVLRATDAPAGVHRCPARELHDGHCGPCTACYGQASRAYPIHGRPVAA